MKSFGRSSVLVRTEEGDVFGSGHFERCKKLIALLKLRSYCRIVWASRFKSQRIISYSSSFGDEYAYFEEAIESSGTKENQKWSSLSQALDAALTKELIVKHQVYAIILDTYCLTEEWERIISNEVRIVTFSDEANRRFFCSGLIDANYYADPVAYRETYSKMIWEKDASIAIGPQYLYGDPTYQLTSLEHTNNYITVYWGSQDSTGKNLIKTLDRLINIRPTTSATRNIRAIFLGEEKIRKSIQANFPQSEITGWTNSMKEFFHESSIHIGTLGSYIWEALHSGAEIHCYTDIDNQQACAQRLAESNLISLYNSVDDLLMDLNTNCNIKSADRVLARQKWLHMHTQMQDMFQPDLDAIIKLLT